MKNKELNCSILCFSCWHNSILLKYLPWPRPPPQNKVFHNHNSGGLTYLPLMQILRSVIASPLKYLYLQLLLFCELLSGRSTDQLGYCSMLNPSLFVRAQKVKDYWSQTNYQDWKLCTHKKRRIQHTSIP